MTTSKRPKLKLVLAPSASCDSFRGTPAAAAKSSGCGGNKRDGGFALTRRLSENCGGGGAPSAGSGRPSPSKWLLPDFACPADQATAEYQLWCDRYAPVTRADLCLHKKKLDELEDWLRGCAGRRQPVTGGGAARLLFVHGPCGAGKSTAVRVLCAGLGSTLACLEDELDGGGGRAGSGGEDALQALLRLGRFGSAGVILWDEPSLASGAGGFGSGGSGGADPLRSVLDQFCARCPQASLVLVTCNERLLPRDWLEERRATIVQVNPVARTQLLRCLNSLLTHRRLRPATHKALVDAVADSADGDVRAAVSGLQFSLQFASTNLSATISSKQPKQQPTMLFRDTPYQLFHAVGKLLHAKREEPSSPSQTQPPPLLQPPESVSERSSLPEELLIAFLQANATAHFAADATAALARLADAFAFADRLCAAWTTDADAKAHAVSLASRAVVYHLCGDSRGPSRFLPIRKPLKLAPRTAAVARGGGGLSGVDAFYVPACLRQRLVAAAHGDSAGGGRPDPVRFVICPERDIALEATIDVD